MTRTARITRMALLALLGSVILAPMPRAQEYIRGFTVGASVGGIYSPDRKSDLTAGGRSGEFKREHDLGYSVNTSLGYSFDPLRVQLEGDYYRYEIDKATLSPGFTAAFDSQIDIISSTFNIYLDIPVDRWMGGPVGLRPYIGGGIGAAYMEGDIVDDDGVIYQGSAGIGYHFGNGLILDLGYRYTNLPIDETLTGGSVESSNVEIHRASLGLRYVFGAGSSQRMPEPTGSTSMAPIPYDGGAPMGSLAMPGPEALPADLAAGGMGQPGMTGSALLGTGMPPRGFAGDIAMGGEIMPAAGGGGYGVQVGAFRDARAAMAAWPAAQRRHGLAGAAPRVVAETVPGKGRMHRLYASGYSKSEADRACARMKSGGSWCRVAAL